MECSYCCRPMGDRDDDVAEVICCACAMSAGQVRIQDEYSPLSVAQILEEKGWTWKDLTSALGASYQRVLQYKNGEIDASPELQKWVDSVRRTKR